MAATNYTPISLYYSTTAAAVPTSGNLVAGELALNTVDEKLYFKNSSGTVKLLASNATSAPVLSFQTSLSGLTPSTATTGVVTLAGTLGVASGGTGQVTLATGALGYGQGTSAHASLVIGTAGQILTVNSGATAPQWTTLTGVAVTTFSAGTTGFTPSSATSGAVTLAGTLATTNGGTGLTSFTSGGVVYASSSSALATGSALTFDGTTPTSSNATGASNFIFNSNANTPYIRFDQTGSAKLIIGASAIVASGAGYDFYGAAGIGLTFFTNAAERLRITSAGDVGIGTSSPGSKLDVNGSVVISPNTAGKNTFQFATNAVDDGRFFIRSNTTTKVDIQANGTSYFEGGTVRFISTISVGNSTPSSSGAGLTFPASQSASSDANTLDDYEEGTWTPTQANFSVTGTPTLSGTYTKIGRVVYFNVSFTSTGTITFGVSCLITLPFSGIDQSGMIAMYLLSNGESQTSGKSGVQMSIDAVNSRFFIGNFTATSANETLNFGGFYRVS